MDRIVRIILTALLYLWQLPQVVVGGLVFCILLPWIATCSKYNGSLISYCTWLERGTGFSLGPFVFVASQGDANLLFHEYGHCVQSRLLGPLYFFVIGLPSLIHYIWWSPDRGVSYFAFYTEHTADQLGGVNR